MPFIGGSVGAQNLPGANLMPMGLVGQTYYAPGDFGLGSLGVMEGLSELADLLALGARMDTTVRKAQQEAAQLARAAAAAARKANQEMLKAGRAKSPAEAASHAATAKWQADEATRLAKIAAGKGAVAKGVVAQIARVQAAAEGAVKKVTAGVVAKARAGGVTAATRSKVDNQINRLMEQCQKAAQAKTARCIAFDKLKDPVTGRPTRMPTQQDIKDARPTASAAVDRQLAQLKKQCVEGSKQYNAAKCIAYRAAGNKVPTREQIQAAQAQAKATKKDTQFHQRCQRNAKALACQYWKENNGKVPTPQELRDWKRNKDKQAVSAAKPGLEQLVSELKTLREKLKTARDSCRKETNPAKKRACQQAALQLFGPKAQQAQSKTQALSGMMGLEDLGRGFRRRRKSYFYGLPSMNPFLQIALPSQNAMYAGMFGMGQDPVTDTTTGTPWSDTTPTGLSPTGGADVFNVQFPQMSNLPPQPRGCTRNPNRPICMFYTLASDSQQMLFTLIQQIMTMMGEIMSMLNELRSGGGGGTAGGCQYDAATGGYIDTTTGMPCAPPPGPPTGNCQYDPGTGGYVDVSTGMPCAAPPPPVDYGGGYGPPPVDYGGGYGPPGTEYVPADYSGAYGAPVDAMPMQYGAPTMAPTGVDAGTTIPEGFDVGWGGAAPEGGEAFIPDDLSTQGMILPVSYQPAAYSPPTEMLPPGVMPSVPAPGGIPTTDQFQMPEDVYGGDMSFDVQIPMPDYGAQVTAPEQTMPMLPAFPQAPVYEEQAYEAPAPQYEYGAPDFEMMPQLPVQPGPELAYENQLPMLPAIPEGEVPLPVAEDEGGWGYESPFEE